MSMVRRYAALTAPSSMHSRRKPAIANHAEIYSLRGQFAAIHVEEIVDVRVSAAPLNEQQPINNW